jgi:hypothetical protein
MQLEDTPRVAPPVLAVFGQDSENEPLADELALDGYDVRLVSDPAQLGEVDLMSLLARRSVAHCLALYERCVRARSRAPVLPCSG